MNAIEFILAGMLAAATPFLLAALGELVVERAGVLNLGVEGLMAFGAVLAFIIVYHGGGHLLGFVVAGLGSAVLSLVFAFVALGFRANQVATGLAIGILGQGLSALFGKTYESLTVKGLPKLAFPGLSEIPVVGKLFVQDIVVWISLARNARDLGDICLHEGRPCRAGRRREPQGRPRHRLSGHRRPRRSPSPLAA